jgi:PKD repeat protein
MGLTVEAGDAVRITATGTWRNGSQVLTAAGDVSQVVNGPNCPLSGAPLLAVAARIGATGTPFLVRVGEAMPVTTSGKLYLAPNDNWYTLWDNTGSLAVTISVGAHTPVPCTGVTATAPATGGTGTPVTFAAQASPSGCTGAVAYQWVFGDGMSSTQGTVSHTYYGADSYTWALSATVDGAAVAPHAGTITVSNEASTARTVLSAPPSQAGVDPVAAMWQDTGLTVGAGDALRITASGTWRDGSQVLTATGDGSQVVTGPNCPLSGAPLLALVARVGVTGAPFLVRIGESMPVTASGKLYLAPNDNWYTLWDNTGSLAVTISVGAPVAVPCTGVTAAAPATGGVGSPVTFAAQASPSGCTGAVAYQWVFGDGMSSAQGTVAHTYYAADSYTWTLSAAVDGVAVAPRAGTITVSNEASTARTVVAAPQSRAGVDPVEAMWQDTGLTVTAGDALRITATGSWRDGSQLLTAAGDGSQLVTGPNCPLSGAPLLALVARIGATGIPFLVRVGEAMPVTASGKLYLAPNDNWYTLWDNAGSLAVTISIR